MSLIAAMPSMVEGRPVMSVTPVRSRVTGQAAAIRMAALRTVISTGRRMTAFTSVAHGPLPGGRAARRSMASMARRDRNRRGSQVIGRPQFTRSPRIASVAGRNVRLPITATSTTAIVPTAMPVNRLIPSVTRPPSEITTAMPEKNTARPAVLERRLDRLVDARAPLPLRSEARDHEQRVVDGDGEAHQHDQLARVRADRRDGLAVQPEEAVRGREARRGEEQRHHGGSDRAEREQQDQERDRDRQPERAVELVVDELLDVVVDERAGDDVDLGVGEPGAHRVDDRRHRDEPLRDHRALAGDVADDLDGRAVRRDEARLRTGDERVDDLVEGQSFDTVDGRPSRHEVGDELVDRRLEGRIQRGALRAADDDDKPLGGWRLIARAVDVKGDLRLELRPVRVLVDVEGFDPARREAAAEHAERRGEPQHEHGPAMARAPVRDADRERRPATAVGTHEWVSLES